MALDGAAEGVTQLITEVGSVLLWMQALGVILLLWIVFEIIALYYHRKRMKEVYAIKEDMKRIEKKIDVIVRVTKS